MPQESPNPRIPTEARERLLPMHFVSYFLLFPRLCRHVHRRIANSPRPLSNAIRGTGVEGQPDAACLGFRSPFAFGAVGIPGLGQICLGELPGGRELLVGELLFLLLLPGLLFGTNLVWHAHYDMEQRGVDACPRGRGHVRRCLFMASDANQCSILLLIVRQQGQVCCSSSSRIYSIRRSKTKRGICEEKLGRPAWESAVFWRHHGSITSEGPTHLLPRWVPGPQGERSYRPYPSFRALLAWGPQGPSLLTGLARDKHGLS